MSKEKKQKPEESVQESKENKPKAPPVIYTPTPFGSLITYPAEESKNQTI